MRLIADTGQNFSGYLAARLVFLTVLLGVAFAFRQPDGSMTPFLTLFVGNAGLSLGGWELYRRWPSSRVLQACALTMAVVIDTLVLKFVGGGHTEFVFLYFFSIASAGLLTGITGSMWVAILSTGGLAWLWLGDGALPNEQERLGLLLYGINFLLAAVLSSYLFGWLQSRERKHAQTLGELRQTRLDTQAILDSLSTGLIVVSHERRILYSNPTGRQILDIAGSEYETALESAMSDQQPMGQLVSLAVSSGQQILRREIEVVTRDGCRPVGVSVSSLKGMDGETRGHILLFTDLTRVKEAERVDRNRERLAAVGLLSRDLAHEIRNPLATVRGCVEMLQREKELEEKKAYMELALRESDRLNLLLRDFLTFARLDVPKKRPGDLASLIRHKASGHAAEYELEDCLPDTCPAEFDEVQIGMVIETMLLSLIEWAEDRACIQLEEGRSPRAVRLLLRDKVIPSHFRETAFTPFSEVQRSSNGLALPTAARAVEAHGGRLRLETEDGVGTWFELEI